VPLHTSTARTLVETTRRELAALLEHEQASLALAQQCSGLSGVAPLFTSILNYRHSVPNPDADWSAVEGIRLIEIREWTNYPVSVSVDDFGQEFALVAQTDRSIVPARMTSYLRTGLVSLLNALEGAPGTPALSLAVLPEEEVREVLEGFNASDTAYSQ